MVSLTMNKKQRIQCCFCIIDVALVFNRTKRIWDRDLHVVVYREDEAFFIGWIWNSDVDNVDGLEQMRTSPFLGDP